METIDSLNKATLSRLRELAVSLRDSQVGLTETAGKVIDKEVVRLFYGIASERATMEQELNDVLHINCEPISDTTSWLGELSHAWTRVRAALSGGDAFVILNEVERSEAMIVASYKRILPEIAGNPLNKLLLEQYERLQTGLTALGEMRDRRKPLAVDPPKEM